jgi:hypoxanthine phosphoribosyltransferase
MSQNLYISWNTIDQDCKYLADMIQACDTIIAIGRGGLVPGTIISYYLDCSLYNFCIQSYENNTAGSIVKKQVPDLFFNDNYRDKKVVVIDDLSDKGNTLNAAKKHLDMYQFTNYKFATLYIKRTTSFTPDYYIKSFDDNIWLDFPWESCNINK